LLLSVRESGAAIAACLHMSNQAQPPQESSESTGWMLPAGIVLLTTAVVALATAGLFRVLGSPLPEAIDGRLMVCFAGAAGIGAMCLAWRAATRVLVKAVLVVVCGTAAAALALLAVRGLVG
jgi:hypothetical protein